MPIKKMMFVLLGLMGTVFATTSSAEMIGDARATCHYAIGDGYGRVEYLDRAQLVSTHSEAQLKNTIERLCRETEREARYRYPGWRFFTEIGTTVDNYSGRPVSCQYNAVRHGVLQGTMVSKVELGNFAENRSLANELSQSRCARKYPGSSCNFIQCR